ncbi:hypothetical protein ACHAXS_005542 [Conticribra weissflogii]
MTRLENITTCLPIAYGSVAFSLGEKADEYHTHRWTLYLRSPNPTYDLSNAISRVIFQLHPSFTQPTRELTKPPFEVTETGWGEFEASIRIVWREGVADERCTMLTHGIRLYPSNNPQLSNQTQPTDVAVVSEKYDEVVFTNPEEEFHRLLLEGNTEEYCFHDNDNGDGGGDTKTKSKSNTATTATSTDSTITTPSKLPYPLSHEPSVIQYFRTYGDEQDVQAMIAAKQFLEKELRNVKDRLMRADVELEEVKAALAMAKGGDAHTGATGMASRAGVVHVTGTVGGSGLVGGSGVIGVKGTTGIAAGGKSGRRSSGGKGGAGAGRPKKSKARSTTAAGESAPSGKKSKTAAAAAAAAAAAKEGNNLPIGRAATLVCNVYIHIAKAQKNRQET